MHVYLHLLSSQFYLSSVQDNERIAVYIRGTECINRAVDGDIVAFELLPEAEWSSHGDSSAASKNEKVGPRFV